MGKMVWDTKKAKFVLLLSFMTAVWGFLAYRRMSLELLPFTKKMSIVISLEAPGFAPQHLKNIYQNSATQLLKSLGLKNDVIATYGAHYAIFAMESSEISDSHILRDSLQRSFEQTAIDAKIEGAKVGVWIEPLINLEIMKLGFPESMPEPETNDALAKLRSLKGVASVTITQEEAAWKKKGAFRLAKLKMIPTASITELSATVRASLPKEVTVLSDDARYVLSSEENLLENVYTGILLTVVCVFAFIRKWKSTLIVAISIPICVLLTIPILLWVGVTKNIMSMAGLALSVGIVVDATLSVVNDFEELMESKKYLPLQAAIKTVTDSLTPLFVATMAASAVFLPILFLSGRVGELFADLSVAVVASNFIGLLVSLLIVPTILALTRKEDHQTKHSSSDHVSGILKALFAFANKLNARSLSIWNSFFEKIVGSVLLSVTAVTLSFTAVGFTLLFVPQLDFLPPPKQGRGVVEGVLPSLTQINLKNNELKTLVLQMIEEIETFGGSEVVVQKQGQKLIAHFEPNKTDFHSLETSLKASHLGMRFAADIDNPLKPFGRQDSDSEFFVKGTPSDLAKFAAELRDKKSVASLILSSEQNELHDQQLRSLPREILESGAFAQQRRYSNDPIFATAGTREIQLAESTLHFWNNEQVTNAAVRLNPEDTTMSFEAGVKKTAAKHRLEFKETASSREASQSMRGLIWCLLSAVAIISIVLWIQIRSIFRSFIILSTFLWAPLGAIPGLIFHGESLNGSALIGFILLAGTIVNNGILLMNRIDKNVQLQMSPMEAARLGVKDRFLNVVITGLTTVLAMIPMIAGEADGAQMYKSLSVVVVYGTIASTPITFIGIPALLTIQNAFLSAVEKLKLKVQIGLMRRRLQL